MINKTIDTIRNELMTSFLNRLPNIDLTEGTSERDMFIESPISGQLMTLWDNLIYIAKTFSPFLYSADLTTDDIKTYMANYDVSVNPATYSSGTVTFYTYSVPTTDITIPAGSIVATDSSTPIEFSVDSTYTMYSALASSYFNTNLNRWEISANVTAVKAGPNYRAGVAAIKKITTPITGIGGCTNNSSVSGGLSEETITSALRRVVSKFQGRGLASTQGVQSFVQSYVIAVNTVGAGDPEMVRDNGYGGAIDFYVIGSDSLNMTDTVVITSAGLDSPLTVNYTSSGIVMVYQPVISISSVLKNGTIMNFSDFELVADTGVLKKSTRALDKIELTSTGITSTGYFQVGDSIEINYAYNSLLHTIENALNDPTNHYENRDYLLRNMTEVTIAVSFRFKELAGQSFDDVATSVSLDIGTFIDGILNNGSVEKADIVGVAKSNAYVDNIDLDSVVLTPTGGGTVTSSGDVQLLKNEYPISGVITLTRWTY